LFYKLGLSGRRDLDLAPDPRSGLEMIMLRMLAFRPQKTEASAPVLPVPGKTPSKPAVAPKPVTEQPTEHSIASEMPAETVAKPEVEPVANSNDWSAIIDRLNIRGLTLQLAHNCVLDKVDDKVCRLLIDPGFQRVSAAAEEKLSDALQKYFGRPLKLEIAPQISQQMTPALEMQKAREDRQQAAVDAINADPNVQALKVQFDARILPGSIEPIN
ncbi:MAG: DNA polymerase III subunit gamma/tau C-terminal domain-containing protein, partial [Methylomonas sp.]|nr:DNA polymerase III subunit gamma/tau C-terminal domain-containing protein [Methylomonas sp.]